jgi:hypothetical protein
MALHATEHAFRSRHPLPQFLPSARHALKALQIKIRENSPEPPGGVTLPAVHFMAEQELIVKLVDELEGILELTRELFGAAAWLNTPPPLQPSTTPVSGGERELGWYSTVSSRPGTV